MKKIILLLILSGSIAAQETPAEIPQEKKTDVFNVNAMSAKEICEALRLKVLEGESFTSVARMYSEDPGSSASGGLYQNVPKGMMVKEFEDVAFKLKVGEVSEVFETDYGFHFLQVQERRGEVIDVRHILIKHK